MHTYIFMSIPFGCNKQICICICYAVFTFGCYWHCIVGSYPTDASICYGVNPSIARIRVPFLTSPELPAYLCRLYMRPLPAIVYAALVIDRRKVAICLFLILAWLQAPRGLPRAVKDKTGNTIPR
jgi:hypothetical protein